MCYDSSTIKRRLALIAPISLALVIVRFIVLLVAFPAHEGAHAVVADRLGDPTPRAAGRITLNPLKHLDIVGSLLFLLIGLGWAQTPISPSYLGRRGTAIVSLAGPIANLLVAALFAVPAHLVLRSEELSGLLGSAFFPSLGTIMEQMIGLNVLLFVFNLVPLPPLDGYRIVLGFLPYSMALSFQRIERFGSLILFALLFLGGGLIWSVLGPIARLVLRLLGF